MWIAIAFIVGFTIGASVVCIIVRNMNDGDLYLNEHDPEYATAGFSFVKGADEIVKKKRIIVRVHSQK